MVAFYYKNKHMADIALKNVPNELVLAIKKRAKENRRSMNKEIIHSLEMVVNQNGPDVEEVIKTAKKLRESLSFSISENELQNIKSKGRL